MFNGPCARPKSAFDIEENKVHVRTVYMVLYAYTKAKDDSMLLPFSLWP